MCPALNIGPLKSWKTRVWKFYTAVPFGLLFIENKIWFTTNTFKSKLLHFWYIETFINRSNWQILKKRATVKILHNSENWCPPLVASHRSQLMDRFERLGDYFLKFQKERKKRGNCLWKSHLVTEKVKEYSSSACSVHGPKKERESAIRGADFW